jgi:Zn-finger domain-containing protein
MSLISEVNAFLDGLSYTFPTTVDDAAGFYTNLSATYERLRVYREEMDFYGFQNPYYVIKGVRDSWKDPFFRQNATKKKIAFDRIQYSLAAHRIALSHMTECAELRVDKRRVTGEKAFLEASETGEELQDNPDGVYNFTVLPNLPYRGEYMLLLSNLPKKDRLSYRKIVSALGQRKGEQPHFRPPPLRREGPLGKYAGIPMSSDVEMLKRKRPAPAEAPAPSHHARGELIVDKYVRKCVGIGYAPLSYAVFIGDMLSYYLKKSKFERERYTSIFPGIDTEPDRLLFGRFGKAIDKKEELEHKLELLHIHEKSSLVGAVAHYLVGEDEAATAEMFNMPAEKIHSAIERFKRLDLIEGKPLVNRRTQQFLDFLKAER